MAFKKFGFFLLRSLVDVWNDRQHAMSLEDLRVCQPDTELESHVGEPCPVTPVEHYVNFLNENGPPSPQHKFDSPWTCRYKLWCKRQQIDLIAVLSDTDEDLSFRTNMLFRKCLVGFLDLLRHFLFGTNNVYGFNH